MTRSRTWAALALASGCIGPSSAPPISPDDTDLDDSAQPTSETDAEIESDPPADSDDTDLPPTPLQTVVLVDFGCDEASTTFGVDGWSQLLRHPQYTQFVNPDGNPEHCGITDTANAPADTAFAGVAGSLLPFELGQRIVATYYHRSGVSYGTLRARVSFDDPDAPASSDWDHSWNTMYAEQGDNTAPIGSTLEVSFNITDEPHVVCPAALPTVGEHGQVNIGFDHYETSPGDWILTKIELRAADTTPPEAPPGLAWSPVDLTLDGGVQGVRLTWDRPDDPSPNGAATTGISRYWIYRDGALYDMVNLEWTAHFGAEPEWVDAGAVPGSKHEYEVVAIDRAVTGYYPVKDTLDDQQCGNFGEASAIEVTTPEFTSCDLVEPHSMIDYEGAFALPSGGSWEYGGQGLAFYPDGNPNADSFELDGSLYVIGHEYTLPIAEIAIPSPLQTANLGDLPSPRVLQSFATPWPFAYDGDWLPDGDVQNRAGLAYHPGDNGIGEGLYYGIFRSYSGDLSAPVHGWFDLDLATSRGPWHIGGLPGSPDHVPFLYTAKFITAVPQGFADANFDGRSLLVGLGWPVSGHGWPSAGPALGVIAPWESGALPDSGGVVSHQTLLRYGTTGDEAHWFRNWTENTGFTDTEWVEREGRHAVVVAGARPVGDEWYGGENGYDSVRCDEDLPATYGGAMFRGQNASEYVPTLYFYDPNDLAAVAAGEAEPSAPQPYAMFDLKSYLYQKDEAAPGLGAIAYDAENGRLYVYESGAGGPGVGVIHVFTVDATSCN